MKKLLLLFLTVFSFTALVACGGAATTTEGEDVTTGEFDGEKIVLITDKGDITDKSFNQGAYEGMVAYADAKGIENDYIKPEEADNEHYVAAIETAIAQGATVIVTPGYMFETPINEVQGDYPDVKFILLDGNPENATDGTLESNVYSVFYAEQESGFLAGYAAVKEGYTHLGFMGGMAVPAVQRFGHGFVQGVAVAAAELGLAENAVTIDYLYTGDFVASPEVQAAAATMYENGVEVIFACGGSVGQSVMAAAEATTDGKVIGVDVDQSADSDTVITSATKSLAISVQQALAAIYEDDTWADDFGGQSVTLDAAHEGVALPDDFSEFENFTAADYATLFDKLVDGTYEVDDTIGAFGDDGTAAQQFATTIVVVNVIAFGV